VIINDFAFSGNARILLFQHCRWTIIHTMFRMDIRQHETIGPWVRKVEAQPGWVTKAALLTAVLVIGLPLLALALLAVTIGLAVFMVLGLVATGLATVRNLFTGAGTGPRPPMDKGRRNVRVLRR